MCGQGGGHHDECDCHEGGHGRHHGGHGCECSCHEGCECECHGGGYLSETHFERRFATRAERIAELEEYLKDLQTEAKAVEERIAEMKAVGA